MNGPDSSAAFVSPDWPALPRVHAVTTTRSGGNSHAPYDTLNLGLRCGDDPQTVLANRVAACRAGSIPGEPVWLTQVHGTNVVEARDENRDTEADASWTREPGIACAVLTADCAPVLFCDRAGTRVAAAHAGWRGLAAGVLEATVDALGTPGELMGWIGPCIRQDSYEVGDDVRAAFPGDGYAFAPNSRGRWQFDLAAVVRARLEATGVSAIYDCGLCTHADAARFFSHRRDGRSGRQAVLIWMT